MNLQKAADEAMAYLDSVGVAAEYEINYMFMWVFTDSQTFTFAYDYCFDEFMLSLMKTHPQKSPA